VLSGRGLSNEERPEEAAPVRRTLIGEASAGAFGIRPPAFPKQQRPEYFASWPPRWVPVWMRSRTDV
jgi:hypothetical protein